jgi:ribonuclease P protein component
MLSKKQRLKTSEFDEVFNFGKTIKKPGFILKIKSNKLPYPRFAVVVSKKVEKSAVKRHFLKRRFYNFVKETKLFSEDKDFILILNKNSTDLNMEEFILTINKLSLQ